jgi:hypothetical protein
MTVLEGVQFVGANLYHPAYPHIDAIRIAVEDGQLNADQIEELRRLSAHLFMVSIEGILTFKPHYTGHLTITMTVAVDRDDPSV